MIYDICWFICLAFLVALIGRMILSFVQVPPGTPLDGVRGSLFSITEPVLAPVRRVVPMAEVGGMGIDISFICVSILVVVLLRLL